MEEFRLAVLKLIWRFAFVESLELKNPWLFKPSISFSTNLNAIDYITDSLRIKLVIREFTVTKKGYDILPIVNV